jgi:hypothetical protein
MSETPQGDHVRRVVDDLEEEIVDVERAEKGSGATDTAEDQAEEVPGSPEPTD